MNRFLYILLLTIFSLASSAQSETHDFVTYDTTFSAGGQIWTARFSRPVEYDNLSHADSEPRPMLLSQQGLGEAGDTSYSQLIKYGPHYWMLNGWDGGITLGNGTHYPLIVTLNSSVDNPRMNRLIAAVQFINTRFRVRDSSLHISGLSMGAYTFSGMINSQLTGGGEEGMKLVRSLVLLQGSGQAATAGLLGSAIAYDATGYSAFGHWAKKYGGRLLGLEGTGDTRNIWQPRDNMEDSVPGSAYFAYENIGGGSHCCWNTMYDPSRRNWKNQQGDLGTNIVWNTNHHNSMGTYQNGWNVFEWQLRQGDTTLIVAGGNQTPTADAGADQVLYLPTTSTTLSGSGSDNDGTISSYQWVKISGPSGETIVSATSASTSVTGLSNGTYTFQLTVTDNDGASASDQMFVNVNADTTVNPSPTGKKIVGNGEYQNLFVDKDGHLWGSGNLGNIGVNNSGTVGIPARVQVTPSDLKFKSAVGGLHGAAAIDTAGNVWITGDNDQYQHGIGNNTHPIYTPSKITVDSAGDPFTNIRLIVGYFVKDVSVGYNGWYVVKEDGTLWGWGTMVKGMRGDGTAGDIKSRPVQIIMPGGRLVQHVIAGQFVIVLCTDGTVWTWGEGASSNNLGYSGTTAEKWYPHQLTGLSNIRMIAGGLNWNYALTNTNVLYGWGSWGNYMGNANGLPISTPTVISNITNALPAPIDKIVTNSASTMVILQDSTMWGWGNAGQGTIGDGRRLNFHINGGNPFDRDNLIQLLPYHVADGILFDTVFGGSTYTYHWYASDVNDSLYCWGRGKASVLANQLRAATSNITATYGNSWDIAWPTPVDPFNISASYISTSDYCVLVSSSGSPCNGYTIPANTAPVADAGDDQDLGDVTETTLDGTGSTDNVFISRYDWRQLSGPNTATITLPASKTPRVFNLIEGTYVFELMVEDNGWYRDSSTVTVTIGTQTNEPPVITTLTSSADTIQSPTSSVNITFVSTDLEGTVEQVMLVQSSPGGSSVSVGSPTSNVYPITGMTVAGTYVFRAFTTDENGVTVYADITVVVLAASSSGAAMSYKVNIYGGTNPQLTDNWNNWNTASSLTINNIIDTTGVASNISMVLSSQYSNVTNTFVSGNMATDTVISTSSYTTQTRNILMTGLEIGAQYGLELYARRSGSNSSTTFSLDAVNKSVLVYNNTDSIVVYPQFETSDGTKTLGITGAPNYISGLKLIRLGESEPVNLPPVMTAGNDTIIYLSQTNSLVIDASASTDPDGTIVSWLWENLDSQYPVSFIDPTDSITQIYNLTAGNYPLRITGTDNNNATSVAYKTVTVVDDTQEENPNQPTGHERKKVRGRKIKTKN